MYAIKDTVSEKLSRLFSDSPSSQTLDQESEAKPNPTEGKSLSSIFSFVLPTVNFDWFRPSPQNNEAKSIKSNSFTWRSKSFSLKDKPLDIHTELVDHECDNREKNSEPGSGSSGRSTSSSSDIFEDATTPHTFAKFIPMPHLLDESFFISPDLYRFFESSLPNIVKGCQWVLLYSTVRHGISLHTLLRKSASVSGPCLLITGDKQGAVFGGLLDCPLMPTAKRKYQGSNQTFVFTTIYGEPRLFRPTGANRYFCLCLNDMIALGGGTNFALCLNEDLLSGTSGPCETFGNMCLAHDQEFELRNVELWGFTHSSQYLN
ncbi:hypothetical protein ACJIZ3_017096 [Penstemon smallii]|uniref:TLDc domain-containing protein n=1 Tax=Penstemon smallii TaxID=265156 RepID=A0ABD3SUL2_9LAMI